MQKFIYTEDTKELLDTVGISEKEFWDFMSLDDWDYALVFDGFIPPTKRLDKLLVGFCSNEWHFFPKQNKTVGISYHS